MWGKLFLKNLLCLKYCLDMHKTKEICDKAVDASLPTLKFAPNWFLHT